MQNSEKTIPELLETFIANIQTVKQLTESVNLWQSVKVTPEEQQLISDIRDKLLIMDVEVQEKKIEGLKSMLEIMKK